MMRMQRTFLCMILILHFASPAQTVCAVDKQPEKIRILIGKYNKSFSVSGIGITLYALDAGPKKLFDFKQNTLFIYRIKNGIKINKNYFDGKRFLITSSGNALSANNSLYSGSIILSCDNDKNILLINEIELEKYLEGLISIELSSNWELSVMKVQAVVARSYALYHKSQNGSGLYHLTSSVLHQLYGGIEHATDKTRRAVKETTGEVLTYNGLPVMASYHSCCGGRTETSGQVWGKNTPYLNSVFCGACTGYEKYFWKLTVPRRTLYRLLINKGYSDCGEVESLTISRRSSSNRAQEIKITGSKGTIVVPGNDFRSLLGFSEMRSTNFIIKDNEATGELQFLGIGFGHGVGLCQWGARAMAQRGETYKDILMHYYPGTKIEKYY